MLDGLKTAERSSADVLTKEKKMKKMFFAVLVVAVVSMFASCGVLTSDASVARSNLEVAEQNFEVQRRVVFYNGITGEYILTIEGRLAIIVDSDGDLVVTVKTPDGQYLKHYLGLSDNVTYFSEALLPNSVSVDSYSVQFKPSAIVPTFVTK
jgi:hypothetical protein